MSTKRNERAKRNKAKLIARQQFQTRKAMQGHGVMCVAYHEPEGNIFFRNDGKEFRVSKLLAQSIAKTQIKWSVTCFAMCRDHNGNNYLKGFDATPRRARFEGDEVGEVVPMLHKDIAKEVADSHWEFLDKEINQSHFLTAGWIATSIGNEFDFETIDKCLESIGCWNEFKTQREAELDGGDYQVITPN